MSATEDIRTLASQYLDRVRDAGERNLNAVCPFHTRADGSPERNPSFYMSTVNGLYYCHSCGASGNLRMFLKHVGVSPVLIESVYRFVLDAAEKSATPPPDPLNPKVFKQTPINEQLLGLLAYKPPGLVEAGFTEETLQYFEVGFDTKHMRTTYPIRDLKGQLVGISGRAFFSDQTPRYSIYKHEYKEWGLPVREGWDKSSVLYHAYRIYPKQYFAYKPEPIVIVEGFKACMWVWQAGVKNVVALIGDSLSWEHKWILERIGAPVYLFLDNNLAGYRGTMKAAKYLSKSLPVSIVNYPERLVDDEGAQPDSCTPEEVKSECYYPTPWYEYIGA